MGKNYDYEPVNSSDKQNADDSSNCCKESKTKVLVAILVTVSILTIVLVSVLHHKAKSNLDDLYSDTVSVDCGSIIGLKEFSKGKTSFVFKGIPYAKPPVRDLRWQPPVSLNKSENSCWQGTFYATSFKSQCVQSAGKNVVGKEDCLYLNVWTPTLNREKKLPVFVWIHGGYLLTGNGSMKGYSPDSEFVTSMNVVAVSMNYRLNAFGFLTLKELWDENKSYGNYGIMDQILVLKWIQNNIKKFGGDPNSVTIAGQSSGGTSIYGLLAAPSAETLFHKAIPMSGSPKFTIDYKQASQDNRIFINNTGCVSANETQMRSCLLSLTTSEVFYAIPWITYPNWAMLDLLDFPSKGLLDGALIVTDPILIKKQPQEISKIDFKTNKSILTGSTAQETSFDPPEHFKNYTSMVSYLSAKINAFSPSFPSIIFHKLYNGSEFENKDAQYLYATITTDVRVSCPTNLLRAKFAESSSHLSYQYIVVNSPTNPIVTSFTKGKLKYAFHAWDSFALFDYVMFRETGFTPSKTDIAFRDNYRNVVKEFILSGTLDKFRWNANQTAIFTESGAVKVLPHDYHEYQCKFWNNKNNGFTSYTWIN